MYVKIEPRKILCLKFQMFIKIHLVDLDSFYIVGRRKGNKLFCFYSKTTAVDILLVHVYWEGGGVKDGDLS